MGTLSEKIEANLFLLLYHIHTQKKNNIPFEFFEKNRQESSVFDVNILIALSGGIDSVAMASACADIKKKHPICNISAAYINHGLQETTEQEHELYVVKSTCEILNIPLFLVDKEHVPKYKEKNNSEFSEIEARDYRYSELLNIAKREGYEYILTAHHVQDSYETIMMRIIEGRGLQGLLGIPVYREIRDTNICIIRPGLVNISMHAKGLIPSYYVKKIGIIEKEMMLKEVKEKNLMFHEDLSNSETYYTRNFIRNKITPLIKNHYTHLSNKRLSENVHRLALDLQDIVHENTQSINEQLEVYSVFNGEKTTLQLRVPLLAFHKLSHSKKLTLLYTVMNKMSESNITQVFLNEFISHCNLNAHYNAINIAARFMIGTTNISIRKDSIYFEKDKSTYSNKTIKSVKTNNIDFNIVMEIDPIVSLRYTLLSKGRPILAYPTKHDVLIKGNKSINIRSHLSRHALHTRWQEVPLIVDELGIIAVAGDSVLAPTMIRILDEKEASGNNKFEKYIMAIQYRKIELQQI